VLRRPIDTTRQIGTCQLLWEEPAGIAFCGPILRVVQNRAYIIQPIYKPGNLGLGFSRGQAVAEAGCRRSVNPYAAFRPANDRSAYRSRDASRRCVLALAWSNDSDNKVEFCQLVD